MFIQIETTPNPNTLKFLPGRIVLVEGTAEFNDLEKASRTSPLATRLLSIDGVKTVFFGYDFISISRNDDHEWEHLKPIILGTIMEHFTSEQPLINNEHETNSSANKEEFFDPKDLETVETIKELLDLRIRPAVAHDGGDIIFRGFENGIVYLTMRGACAGCPSSTATLKLGIENLLKHFLPEVLSVEAIN